MRKGIIQRKATNNRIVRGIYLVRKWLDFDRSTFANALGMSLEQYKAYENGRYIPEKLQQTLLIRLQILSSLLGIVPELLTQYVKVSDIKRLIKLFNETRKQKLLCEVTHAIERIKTISPMKRFQTIRKELKQLEKKECKVLNFNLKKKN